MHFLTFSNFVLILLATATFLFLATPILGGIAIYFKWIPEHWQARVSELLDESPSSVDVNAAVKRGATWSSQPTALVVQDDMKHEPEYVVLQDRNAAPQHPRDDRTL